MVLRRKRYLIKRAFQIKYTALILFFIFLTVIISCTVTYFAIFPYLSEKLANVYPQGRLLTVIKSANMKILIYSAWLLPIAAWFGMILSHSIAGPWYRLENILADMASGVFNPNVKLRKGDELQSLATAINDITRSLISKGQKNLIHIDSLTELISTLEKELGREPVDIIKTRLLVSKIQDIFLDLKSLIRSDKPA